MRFDCILFFFSFFFSFFLLLKISNSLRIQHTFVTLDVDLYLFLFKYVGDSFISLAMYVFFCLFVFFYFRQPKKHTQLT